MVEWVTCNRYLSTDFEQGFWGKSTRIKKSARRKYGLALRGKPQRGRIDFDGIILVPFTFWKRAYLPAAIGAGNCRWRPPAHGSILRARVSPPSPRG